MRSDIDVRHGLTDVDPAEPLAIGHTEHDEISGALTGGVDDRGRRVARLEKLRLDMHAELLGDGRGLFEDLLPTLRLVVQHRVEREIPAHLDDVDGDDLGR